MKALSWAVDRPLPVFLVAAVVVLVGAWSLDRLPVNRAPDIEIPFALVVATYAGAAPEDVESELAIGLEERLNTLQDLRHITTVAREGVTTHFLEFEDRADMDESVRKARQLRRMHGIKRGVSVRSRLDGGGWSRVRTCLSLRFPVPVP